MRTLSRQQRLWSSLLERMQHSAPLMTRMQQEQHRRRRPGVALLARPRRRTTATSTAAAVKSSTMIRRHTRSRCLVQTSPGGAPQA